MDKSTSSFKKKNNPLDVLFVNLPTYSPDLSTLDDATSGDSLTPPLGILYLSHSIKDCSFVSSYQCADFSADFKLPDLRDFLEKNSLPEFVNKKLKKTIPNKPDVVAISLMFSSTYDFFQIVIEEIKKIYDPEIPVNIYELGLIYKIDVDEKNKVNVDMTLTSPNCPVAESLPNEVKENIKKVEGVSDVNLNLVWEPPWDKDKMSEAAKLELNL